MDWIILASLRMRCWDGSCFWGSGCVLLDSMVTEVIISVF